MNHKKSPLYLLFFLVSLLFLSCGGSTNKTIVHSIKEFNTAVSQAKPGDVIALSNGVWKDVELLFEAHGTKEKPITLTVQEKGKVTLEGFSNLRIAGENLIVKGLVFKNGYTPTNEVISFRKNEKLLANNSRLTECVIDNYNNPERHEQDAWVVVYGKNNRVDHCHLEGKTNRGVTLVVRLNTEESRENAHRIDHNYFGPRPNLGSNGGETLRIGTSHFSLTNSKTIVEYNFFDRCNGEHEIISNKSCQNIYRFNTFYECVGTLTMRHGNETHVEGNVFIGNGKPHTGGVRVINGQQTVINNYCVGLTGHRFRGALVVMNGVPNSPLNRYFQVDGATITGNTFINCDNIQLCAGSDSERSAVPINSVISGNVFYHEKRNNVFTIYDNIAGIEFKDNVISQNISDEIKRGFKKVDIELTTNEQGYLVPKKKELNLFSIPADVAKKETTGVKWYPKEEKRKSLNSGKVIQVKAGENTLYDAIKGSQAGDILELVDTKEYLTTKTIEISHPLSFRGKTGEKPTVFFQKKSLFRILNGGMLSLENLVFDGSKSPDYSGNSVITTDRYSMKENYNLVIDNCAFLNLNVNHSFNAIKVFKNTFADSIKITNSRFSNITGHVLALDAETDNTGIYNAEFVTIKNTVFSNVGGSALALHRGGKDESTFGPILNLSHCVFDNVGNGKRNKNSAAIALYGVQVINIKNNIFSKSKKLKMHLVVGEPIVNILNNNFFSSEKHVITGDQKYTLKNIWNVNPKFSDMKTYALSGDSPLKSKGTNGQNLGVLTKK